MRAAVIVLLLSIAGSASAQTEPEDPAVAEARAEFERGALLAEQRRFDEAAEAFARSLELAPRPSTAFNLGACLYARGRHLEAIAALERYLASADPALEASGIADADRMLAHSRRSVSELTSEVVPEAARVPGAGAALAGGAARSVRLDPGTHVIRAEAEGHAPALIEVETRSGESTVRAVHLASTRLPARLVVDAPDGARVRVDDREVDREAELEAGTHRIEVDGPGLVPMTRTVELEWNERLRVAITPAERTRGLLEEPAFWIGALGTAAAIGLGVLVGVLAASPSGADGGSTGIVLTAPRVTP